MLFFFSGITTYNKRLGLTNWVLQSIAMCALGEAQRLVAFDTLSYHDDSASYRVEEDVATEQKWKNITAECV